MYSSTLARIKEVRKGLEIEHKSTGVLQIFFHNYWSANHSGKIWIHLFIAVLLSGFPFLKESHSFMSHSFFQEENLPRGNVECLGFWTLKTSGLTLVNTRTPRPLLKALGRGLLCPLAPIIFTQEIRESNSIQQLMGKSKLLLFPQNGRHPEMLPVAEGTRVHGEGRDSGAIWDVYVGFVANYKSWYVSGLTPIRYGQQNAQHLNMQLLVCISDKKRVEMLNAGAALKVQCIVHYTKHAGNSNPF